MEDIPWPVPGDIVFSDKGDWSHTAVLDAMLSVDWYSYAMGYREAADMLVEQIAAKPRWERDVIVYPCVFLYRQYLELMMKALIEVGWEYLDETVPQTGKPRKVPNTHNLNQLWDYCRVILRKVWPKGPDTDLRAVGRCIAEFSGVDPGSYTFRYPVDTKGNPSISELRAINLVVLRETMEKLGNFFSGDVNGISDYIELRQEIASEFSL